MIFTQTPLPGAYVIDIERRADNRGFFARTWCLREFETHGLNPNVVQINATLSARKGTLRGLHYQVAPYQEVKIVRCTRGALYDVIVDLRPQSPAYKQWLGVELTEDNHRMLYVPEGFAHGSQTLTDNTELWYQTSQFYAPEAARGVRFDDPAFQIKWPLAIEVVSDPDKNWPDYSECEAIQQETFR
jgi:dTDP-4-dehydrorhamnose 3,5-epimerase